MFYSFQYYYFIFIIHFKYIRIEKDKEGNQAALLAFYPEFQYDELVDNEFISFYLT